MDSDQTTDLKATGPSKLNIFDRLCELEAWTDKKLGVESDAVIRKLPEERTQVKWYQELTMACLWASGCMNLACYSTGFLGWESGLSLKQSLVCYAFGTLIGSAGPAYCATFGSRTGLRQMSVSRYSFGWFPSKVIALLNTIVQIGWSAVGDITGGLALKAVADGHLSVVVGIIIIAVVALFVSLFGIRVILVWERYAWIAMFVIFMIVFGESAKYTDNTTPPQVSGKAEAGAVLTVLAIAYGSCASWAPTASDYYVSYPENVSRVKVFFFTLFGMAIPTCVGFMAGAVSASTMNIRSDWKDIYEDPDRGIGYFFLALMSPEGFAKFLLVLLVLSSISVNIVNMYSGPISFQQISPWFTRVPRIIWTLIFFGITITLGLAGRKKLNEYLQNFTSLLGYWCTSYIMIVFMEHVVIRKADFKNYDLDGWNDPKRLPHGFAAAIVFLIGVVCWVMGMNETWYSGPLSQLFGENGGDVANEFTFVVTVILYVPLRLLEIKIFGK